MTPGAVRPPWPGPRVSSSRARGWATLVLGLALAGCVGAQDGPDASEGPGPPAVARGPAAGQGAAVLEVRLRPDRPHQTIESFGASDAWSIQFVGTGWPAEQRERIADLLFSLDLEPDGSPAGIGLSAWRFNLGAGSAAQGAESGIRDEWRRAESFLRADGGYDWSRQAGQRWFLRAARDRGVHHFIGFVNSPPVALTRNGLAHSSGGDASNLAPDRYDDFARYLRDVVMRLEREEGVRLDHVSPVNEPQWDWEGGQEGTPWLNHEVRDVVAEISAAFTEAGLDTRISVPEAARLDYLVEEGDRPGRGDQAAVFFDSASPLYIGDLPAVENEVAGHSYFTTWSPDTLVAVRARLRHRLRAIDSGLRFAMSEYCVLEDNPEIQGRGRDLGMATALYVARVVHADLTVADAAAWHWWLAVSPYDYKDGLVYIDRSRTGGAIHESKLLWALGNFSRFVRPGMRRIEVERSDGLPTAEAIGGVLVSAFRDPATDTTVVVVVNQEGDPVGIRVRGDGLGVLRGFITSSAPGDDLRFVGEVPAADVVAVPGRSLVTLVGRLP
jgi:O-glycosyl hydrolase